MRCWAVLVTCYQISILFVFTYGPLLLRVEITVLPITIVVGTLYKVYMLKTDVQFNVDAC